MFKKIQTSFSISCIWTDHQVNAISETHGRFQTLKHIGHSLQTRFKMGNTSIIPVMPNSLNYFILQIDPLF